MKQYSPLFETLYDEPDLKGKMGHGYSIFRAHYKTNQPYFYFALIWDEDHDERVLECLERLYHKKLLHHYLLLGERKGGFTFVLPPDQPYQKENNLPEGYELREGDYWPWHVLTWDEVGNGLLIRDSKESILLYVNTVVEKIESFKGAVDSTTFSIPKDSSEDILMSEVDEDTYKEEFILEEIPPYLKEKLSLSPTSSLTLKNQFNFSEKYSSKESEPDSFLFYTLPFTSSVEQQLRAQLKEKRLKFLDFSIYHAPSRLLKSITGLTSTAYAIQWLSHDRILLGNDEANLEIWDLQSESCIRVLEGHQGSIRSLVLLSQEQAISGSIDGTLRVWDLNTGKCTLVLEGHQHYVRDVAVINEQYVVSASQDQTIKLWELSSGTCVQTFEGHTGGVHAVTLIKFEGEAQVISASEDKTLRLWDIEERICLHIFEGHQRIVTSVKSVGSDYFISTSDDGTLKLWSLETRECSLTLEGHQSGVYDVTVIGARYVLSASLDATLKLWDVRTGECLQSFEGHTDSVLGVVLNQGYVISISCDHTLKIWEFAPSLTYQDIASVLHNVTQYPSILTDISLEKVLLNEEAIQHLYTLLENCAQLRSLNLRNTGLTEIQIQWLKQNVEMLQHRKQSIISLNGLPDSFDTEFVKVNEQSEIELFDQKKNLDVESSKLVKKFSIPLQLGKKDRNVSVYGFPDNTDVQGIEVRWQQQVVSKFFKLGKRLKENTQSFVLYQEIIKHTETTDKMKFPVVIDKVCRRSLVIALSKILSEKEKMPQIFLKMGATIIEIRPPAEAQDYKRRRQWGNFQMKVVGESYDIAYGKMCMNKYRYLTHDKWDGPINLQRLKTLLKLFSEKIKKFEAFYFSDLNQRGKIKLNQEKPGVGTEKDVKQNVNFLNGLLFLVTIVEVLVRLYRDEEGQIFRYESKEAKESDTFPVAMAQARSIKLLLSGQITFRDFVGESQRQDYNSEQHRALYGCVTGKETINHLAILWNKLSSVNQKYNDWLFELEEWKAFKQEHQITHPESHFIRGRTGMFHDLTTLYGSGSESDSETSDYSDHEDMKKKDMSVLN